MDRLIFAGVLALIAVIVADRWMPRTEPVVAGGQVPAGRVSAPTAVDANAASPTSAPSIDPGSIAVLPFVDLSPAGDQAWFADGIIEEVLNVLVGVEGLTVAARTGSIGSSRAR